MTDYSPFVQQRGVRTAGDRVPNTVCTGLGRVTLICRYTSVVHSVVQATGCRSSDSGHSHSVSSHGPDTRQLSGDIWHR